MEAVFVSNYVSSRVYVKLVKKSLRMGQQNQKYVRLILGGLNSNNIGVTVVSVPPVNSRNCDSTFIAEKSETDRNVLLDYVGIINLPIIRNISAFLGIIRKTIKHSFGKKDIVIVIDLLNFTSSVASLIAARLLRKKTLGILTDMPTVYVGNEGKRPTIQQRLSQWLCKNCPDSYLFVSEAMNTVVNIKNKPYAVIEGFADIEMKHRENLLSKKEIPRVCLYAGGLNKLYGLDMLVEGFIKADIPDCELHIYGDGAYTNELKAICETHHNVRYYGVADNADIVEAEEQATLLINPRYTNSEFTLYSFPSKNIEYMASGTPILTTKLPSMPKDYYPYIFTIDEENVEGFASALKSVMNLSSEELFSVGQKAKEWILNTRSNISLTKKIVDVFVEVLK